MFSLVFDTSSTARQRQLNPMPEFMCDLSGTYIWDNKTSYYADE